MRAYFYYNKAVNSSLVAFIFSSVFLFLAEILNLISTKAGSLEFQISELSSLLISLVPYIFSYFITISLSKEDRYYRAFVMIVSLLIFSSLSGTNNILLSMIISFSANYIFNKFERIIAYISVIIFAVILGLILFYISDYFYELLMLLASVIEKSGHLSPFLYGVFSTIFNSASISTFDELFYFRSYGGSLIVNNEIVTGIKDMAQNGYTGKLVSSYLSGHYFQLFTLTGTALALGEELKGSQRLAMLFTFILAVLSGDLRLCLIFLFLESHYLLFLMILLFGGCYLVSNILDIASPFIYNGGAVEMLFNINNPVYLLCGGIVFTAIGFFVTKFVSLKFGLSDSFNIYIPTRLKTFVEALGGAVNIVKIEENTAQIRNPKLVNTFEIDCNIKENKVKINDERIYELKEYL